MRMRSGPPRDAKFAGYYNTDGAWKAETNIGEAVHTFDPWRTWNGIGVAVWIWVWKGWAYAVWAQPRECYRYHDLDTARVAVELRL